MERLRKKLVADRNHLFSLCSLSLLFSQSVSLAHIGWASPAKPSLIEKPPLSRTTTRWLAEAAAAASLLPSTIEKGGASCKEIKKENEKTPGDVLLTH